GHDAHAARAGGRRVQVGAVGRGGVHEPRDPRRHRALLPIGCRRRARAHQAREAHLGLRRHRVRRSPAPVRDVLFGLAARCEPPHVSLLRLGPREADGPPLPGGVLMPTLGLVNIGALATGVLEQPRAEADAILVESARIAAIGAASRIGAKDADVVVDCLGTTVIPGLIDSHCHVVLGDYTPRQKTVDFLDSYVHGGITSVVSAGEGVHAPGRPHDPVAAKALAIAAAKCFENFHPNGMKVNAGTGGLEPGLTRRAVPTAKYGSGGYAQPRDGEPEVRRAQKHGLCVMSHSGGTSIPGSSPISHEVLLHLRPDVCGHVNGGTTALDEEGIGQLLREGRGALQVVQAGNLRSALYIVKRAREAGALERVCVASDTPTGTGVMPMGVMKSVCELASLSDLAPEI